MIDNKQSIQWFPGHMTKARRKIKEILPLIDAVAEVVDARIPLSSRNPELESIIGDKPHIILLNKCDMADREVTAEWIKFYKQKNITAIPIDCKSGKGLNTFKDTVKSVLADRLEAYRQKGMIGKPLRIMVVGIPNVGKSTFINSFAGKACAKTGNKPGVTKGKQWIKLNKGLELLDTPGILWPKFEDQEVGKHLAFIGSMNDEIIIMEELACDLIQELTTLYPQALKERYSLEELGQPIDVLRGIAENRKCYAKGEELDLLKASNLLVDDFRSGKLGRVTMERP